MDLLDRIDHAIEEQHLLKHPFYQKWMAGTLSDAALRDYARQYYAFESAFPRFLSALHARTDEPELRAHLLRNLWDEEYGDANHVELWLQFAEGLGLTRDEVRAAERTASTAALLDAYRAAVTDAPVAAGVAALYAYEKQFPAVARAKVDGLRNRYGVDDARTLGFFQTHATLDVEHAAGERKIIAGLGAADEEAVIAAARAAIDAWWRFLDGVDTAPSA